MNKRHSVNSVFPYLEKKVESKPISSGTKQVSYDRRVKVTDWQNRYLVEPRDNTNFFPPEGNLQIATYRRLGTYEPQKYLSETQEKMIKHKPCDFEKCFTPAKMLHIFSFPLTDADEKPEFETEIQNKYKMYCTPENIPTISKELPNTLYRRTLGYSLEDLAKLEGMRTFLDDDLEVHKKIADLKSKRNDR